MVSHRQRRDLYTGSKLHGQFEGRLSGPSPIISAGNALKASLKQLQAACDASPITSANGKYQWYQLFSDLSFPTTAGIRLDYREQQQAQVALMRITDEQMQGPEGVLAQVMVRCQESGLMAAEGATPTAEQIDFAVAMKKLGDKHARYHAVLREQNALQR